MAEHYNGLVVVTLPRGDVKSVSLWSQTKRVKGKFTLKFRSVGDAGDAWADYTRNGARWQRKLGATIVEVRSKNGRVRRFLLPCPSKRSDGKEVSNVHT